MRSVEAQLVEQLTAIFMFGGSTLAADCNGRNCWKKI